MRNSSRAGTQPARGDGNRLTMQKEVEHEMGDA
jgi:hypothetical protein